ncbi:MAG: hypothetical protein HUJ51_01995 [Eggerthellaceae bacterium]|nr:hypothetical protein [Eggerthellaceae bacterium]
MAPVLQDTEMIIVSILIPGAAASQQILEEHIDIMKKGAAIVDDTIDHGGCAETDTAKVTYHNNPVYKVASVIHYWFGNILDFAPLTSTLAHKYKIGLWLADCKQGALVNYQGQLRNHDRIELL